MCRLAVVLFAALFGISSSVNAATLFQTVPDLSVNPLDYGLWCSSCAGSYQIYEGFSLGDSSNISEIKFNAGIGYVASSITDRGRDAHY